MDLHALAGSKGDNHMTQYLDEFLEEQVIACFDTKTYYIVFKFHWHFTDWTFKRFLKPCVGERHQGGC